VIKDTKSHSAQLCWPSTGLIALCHRLTT